MTYEARYTLVALTGEANLTDLTLYEAVKALTAAAARGVIHDGTHIRRDGRCVGFWSLWHNGPRAMWEARASERYLILAWS